jgi:antitoxin (DNA-binding transcriptional repressor) of toxin-antitoxin stability system
MPERSKQIIVTSLWEVKDIKFVGVREFKQDAVKYLNEGNEIVVMKRKKPIARLTRSRKTPQRPFSWTSGGCCMKRESRNKMRSGLWRGPDRKSMAKVVLDPNVIISAAFGGKPLEAVGRALKEHDVYISERIIGCPGRLWRILLTGFPLRTETVPRARERIRSFLIKN